MLVCMHKKIQIISSWRHFVPGRKKKKKDLKQEGCSEYHLTSKTEIYAVLFLDQQLFIYLYLYFPYSQTISSYNSMVRTHGCDLLYNCNTSYNYTESYFSGSQTITADSKEQQNVMHQIQTCFVAMTIINNCLAKAWIQSLGTNQNRITKINRSSKCQ